MVRDCALTISLTQAEFDELTEGRNGSLTWAREALLKAARRQRLGDDWRVVIAEAYSRGLHNAAIAAETGYSVATVRQRLSELKLRSHSPPHRLVKAVCSEATPCCERRDEYNGFGTGPHTFECPKSCPCHD